MVNVSLRNRCRPILENIGPRTCLENKPSPQIKLITICNQFNATEKVGRLVKLSWMLRSEEAGDENINLEELME